jgi:hypothetical protein
MADLALKLRGAQLLRPKNAPSVCTSCVSFVKTSHLELRAKQRNVDWKEVQACLKHGVATSGRRNTLRIEYNGVVVITTLGKRVLTSWRSAPRQGERALLRFAERCFKLLRNAFGAWRRFPKPIRRHSYWLLGLVNKPQRSQVDLATDVSLLFRAWKLFVDFEHARRVHDIVCADGKRWARDVALKRTVYEAWAEESGLRTRLFANGSVLHLKSYATCDARYCAHVLSNTA